MQAVLEPIFKSIFTWDKLNIDWSEVAYNALMGALTGGVFEAPGNAAAVISEANALAEETGRVPPLPRINPEETMRTVPPLPRVGNNAESTERGTVPPLPKVGTNAAAQSDAQDRAPSLPTVESVRQCATEAEGVDIAPNQTVPGLESTSINDDPAQHTSEEMNRINEYKRATDVGILNFINKVRGLKNPKYRNSVRYPFSDVTPKAVQMVRTLTGVDASGFKNVLTGSVVDHVTRRHGAHGKADHSMANDNDIARMRYVLDNFDNAALLQNTDGTPSVSDVWKNSDGTPAQRIIFTKKIDGTYYVVEATPDSNAKVLAVESVFIGNINRSTGTVLNIENDSPQVTSETPQRANAPANNISQAKNKVNGKTGSEPSPFLYLERLAEQAKKNGNLYTQRLLQRQIEKAMQNSRSANADASTPTPTIYADYIREHNMLEDYEETLGIEKADISLENAEEVDTISEKDFELSVNTKQLGKKIGKHASDFNLDPKSEKDRATFLDIVRDIMEGASEIAIGVWRGQTENVVFTLKALTLLLPNKMENLLLS